MRSRATELSTRCKYYQTLGPGPAQLQLTILLNSALRRVLGEITFTQVVRDKRAQLMVHMRDQIDHDPQHYGIPVVDARIRRADLPEQNSQAVYQRMQTERQREAAEYRAQGSQKSQEIRAKADRDVTVLLAEANSQAEQIRGQGDSERNRIFADAYNRDPGFFTFYRSMQAYDKSMQRGETRLVLKPDTDFFRYFSNPAGPASCAIHRPSAHRRRHPARQREIIAFANAYYGRALRPACSCPTFSPRSAWSLRSKASCLRRFRSAPSAP